jgi:ArsR family transcriptional regulator
MQSKHYQTAKIFKACCDETRLMVLEHLQAGEQCACVLLAKLRITQPTLSHHMKILVDSGLVSARKDGKWTFYSVSEAGCENAVQLLRAITAGAVNVTDKEECCL